jgi:branched-chain amino acid transport system substrate-binding protein
MALATRALPPRSSQGSA